MRFQFLLVDDDQSFATALDPSAVEPLELKVLEGTGGDAGPDGAAPGVLRRRGGPRASATTSTSRCPPGKQSWEVVGIVEDTPIIFTGAVTTLATFDGGRASSRPTTR